MRRRLPSLNALRAFEAAGRLGSLTAAAQELRVSVAAISRHVTLLEAHFGQRLLRRHRLGVEPTPPGAAYLAEIGAAFTRIGEASDALDDARAGRQLKVRFYTTFATEWLAPRLPAFRAAHPEIALDLSVALHDGDVREVDLALSAMPPRSAGLHMDRLFETVVTLVCTPELRAGSPPLESPADLSRHTLLAAPRERRLWRPMLAALGQPPLEQMPRLEFESLSLTLQAARGGGGVALANLFFVMDDIRAGRLIAPFDMAMRLDVPHLLISREDRQRDRSLSAMRGWLIAEAARTTAQMEAFLRGRHVVDGDAAAA